MNVPGKQFYRSPDRHDMPGSPILPQMPNMTFSILDDLHKEIRSHPGTDWPEVCRRAIRQELARLHPYDRLLADSKLTEEDAVALGREINRRMAERYGKDA